MAAYNPIAWLYDRHWPGEFHPWVIALLEKAFLPRIPDRARLLDVCCGTGVIAAELTRRGHRVTGVDASEQMLRHARRNSPASHFIVADVTHFRLQPAFDAAISTFDSLNHILTPGDLLKVFENVRHALVEGGLFLFDVNLEHAYLTAWNGTYAKVEDQFACFMRGNYDPQTRLGQTDITLFEHDGCWTRRDVTLMQRCHPEQEVLRLLGQAGFSSATSFNAIQDFGLPGRFGEGRAIVLAGC